MNIIDLKLEKLKIDPDKIYKIESYEKEGLYIVDDGYGYQLINFSYGNISGIGVPKELIEQFKIDESNKKLESSIIDNLELLINKLKNDIIDRVGESENTIVTNLDNLNDGVFNRLEELNTTSSGISEKTLLEIIKTLGNK